MPYEELTKKIMEAVGGRDNIVSAVNCMTRLRIHVKEDAAVDVETLKALDKVLAVMHPESGYYEVVVGPGISSKCGSALRALGVPGSEGQTVTDSKSLAAASMGDIDGISPDTAETKAGTTVMADSGMNNTSESGYDGGHVSPERELKKPAGFPEADVHGFTGDGEEEVRNQEDAKQKDEKEKERKQENLKQADGKEEGRDQADKKPEEGKEEGRNQKDAKPIDGKQIESSNQKKKKGTSIFRVFGQIFAPMIPGIVAAGICSGISSLIAQAVPGYTDQSALLLIYNLLHGISVALMTYLTAWTGYRAAEVFGGTPVLGGMLGMIATLDVIDSISQVIGLYNEAEPLRSILRQGRGGVLAVILGVWLMCKIEQTLRAHLPNAMDTVFTPLLTLLISLVPYIFVLMPVIGMISTGLCKVVELVAMSPNALVRMLAGYISAAIFLPMVAAGMHHGLIALYTVQLETLGYVTLYPALAMAGAGQVGAAIAIALKARKAGDLKLCRIINGTLPAAVLGVGEPLIYSVTLPMGRPFLTAGLGAGFGGAFVMLMQVASTTWGPSGVLGVFVMTEGPLGAAASVGCYVAGLLISVVMGYIITWIGVRSVHLE